MKKKKSVLKAMSNNEDGIPYSDKTSEKMRTNKKGQKIYKTKTRTKDGYVEKEKVVKDVQGNVIKKRKVRRKTAPKFIKDVFKAIKDAKAKKDAYSQKAPQSAAKGASESAGMKKKKKILQKGVEDVSKSVEGMFQSKSGINLPKNVLKQKPSKELFSSYKKSKNK